MDNDTKYKAQESEAIILSNIFLNTDYVLLAVSELSGKEFYSKFAGQLFKYIKTKYENNQAVDRVIAESEFKEQYEMNKHEYSYFLDLMNTKTKIDLDRFESHIKLVKQKYAQRTLEELCYENLYKLDTGKPINDILEQSVNSHFNISQTNFKSEFEYTADIVNDCFSEITKRYEDNKRGIKDRTDKITSGLYTINAPMGGGFRKGGFHVISGRPGMGKSMMVINLLKNQCIDKGFACLFFSLEMTKKELLIRLASLITGINYLKIENGALSYDEYLEVKDAYQLIKDSRIAIDDSPFLTISEIKIKIQKFCYENESGSIGCVYVDYMQLVTGSQSENRVKELDEIAYKLKGYAKDYNIPVIALAQLSRKVEQRPNKRPMLSDLRESGGIEAACDTVVGLYRDEYYNEQSNDKGVLEYIFMKNRQGESRTVKLFADLSKCLFTDLENKTIY